AWDGDIPYSFRHSPVAIVSLAVFLLCVISALLATWVAPHNPFDLRTLSLADANLPSAWESGGKATFLRGTDSQGRDVFSAIIFGARVSLLVGLASVVFAMTLGIVLGLVSGYI